MKFTRTYSKNLLELILFICLTFTLFGCETALIRPQLDSSINYQRDVSFKVSMWLGNKGWSKEYGFNGAGVVGNYPSYKITVYPPGKADMITVTSCHREIKTANPKKNGWFKKGYTFQFSPVPGVETGKSCPIDIGIYEKKAGRHGWAMLAIDDGKRHKLYASTKCNGKTKEYYGVSVCQAKKGLIQEYKFKTPVAVANTIGCEIKTPKDKMNWEFLMPPGSCTVYFIERKNPDNIHQANFFGYDTIPIRGVE